MIRGLLIVLLLCSCAFGAARVVYVDTGAGGSNNGTSWTNAYTSLQGAITAEVAADADLTNDDTYLTIYLRRTGAGAADTPATLDGFTCDATHYPYIVQTDTNYIIDNANASIGALTISDEFTRVDGLRTTTSSISGSERNGIHVVNVSTCTIYLTNCEGVATTLGTASGRGLKVNDNNATVYASNLLLYGWYVLGDTGFQGVEAVNGTTYLYNSTIYGNTVGATRTAGSLYLYNCAVGSNSTDFSGDITKDYCCYVGGAGTNHDTSPNSDNWALEFTDAAAGDFTLLATATGCLNTGTADPGGADQPDTDIIGTARPQGAAWDIGVYERRAGGPIKYYQQLLRTN